MATAPVAPPTLVLRGRTYPVLLPKVRDPRLHLAAVIISLQVLGQAALGFRVSIAQILVSLVTCAVIEMGIALRRDRVIMWPASALITGNGVAFVLRVPGTEHGDWWSLHGAWIFAATGALGLLSKYAFRVRGRHVFNPSNIGLVVCFLVLGSDRAEPLDFWWGALSPPLVLALTIIVVGGVAVLSRLRHLGPVRDAHFWWVLVSSPEVLVFLFFMITDPKTIPYRAGPRVAYGVAVGLLAVLLIAPQTQEFGTKVALLGALALVCAARPVVEWLVARGRLRVPERRSVAGIAAAAAYCAAVLAMGGPARTGDGGVALAATQVDAQGGPAITIVARRDIASRIEPSQARSMARDIEASLLGQTEALRALDPDRAATAADGPWLLELVRRIDAGVAGRPIVVPTHKVERVRFTLARRPHQMMPAILATLEGTVSRSTYTGGRLRGRSASSPYRHTFEIAPKHGHYLLVTDELPPGWRG